MARPPKHTDADKPANVSLRIPRDLYDQVQHNAQMRRTTLTALVIEGLRLCLETPADPRDIIASRDNTAMQELEQLIDERIALALAKQASAPLALPMSSRLLLPHDENITAMQQ